jgi:hypothetical protein
MSTNHTAGPWSRVDAHTGRVKAPIVGTVANVTHARDVDLICAAPDLFEVVRQWAEFMRSNYSAADMSLWEATERALAKARGET